ncbi:hypothetical protein PCANC_18131 [Puccinia coronata f. sp. avenae]|uniref:Uncharacterized protein n=1 Tax=Puccinia coronata f. sp. avenae TaxID=200324 RepID=A0A2N5SH60_9BASI|nr:hypothetical protein PCANC_18131 [Puccinia coronata f. sp. avenae]
MDKIQRLFTPRGSPTKEGQAESPAKKTRLSPLKAKRNSPKKSPKKSPNKLRKLQDDSTLRSGSSGNNLSSSFVLVPSQETFLCETRPVEGTSTFPAADTTSKVVPGPLEDSPSRNRSIRSPIQTRSRTLAAAASAQPIADSTPQGLPADSYDDTFPVHIPPLPEEALPAVDMEVVPGNSTTNQDITLTHSPVPSGSSPTSETVIYVDSFPGMKNVKNSWNIFDSFTIPPTVLAEPPSAPSDHPAPRRRDYQTISTGASPPKKRRLMARRVARRVDRFASPLRPRLETIPEDNSSGSENDQDGNRASTPLRNSTLSDSYSPQSVIIKDAPNFTPSDSCSPQSIVIKDSPEFTCIPPSTSTQKSSRRTDPNDPRHSPSLKRTMPRNSPSGSDSQNQENGKGASKPDPNVILSSLFKMLEEDTV